MKQVRVFQTGDGRLFDNREMAEGHELTILIRGVIQSTDRSASFTPTQMAEFISKNQDQIYDVIRAYRARMGSIKAAKTRSGS